MLGIHCPRAACPTSSISQLQGQRRVLECTKNMMNAQCRPTLQASTRGQCSENQVSFFGCAKPLPDPNSFVKSTQPQNEIAPKEQRNGAGVSAAKFSPCRKRQCAAADVFSTRTGLLHPICDTAIEMLVTRKSFAQVRNYARLIPAIVVRKPDNCANRLRNTKISST